MKTRSILAALALTAIAASQSQAQNTATQTVTFQVNAITRLAFTGSPSLTITDAVPGDAPTSVTASGTWALTNNQLAQKITASIASNMPGGLTLSADVAAPTLSGTSLGKRALSTATVDVITGVGRQNQSGLNVTYTLDATSDAGSIGSSTRVVTYTITTGA